MKMNSERRKTSLNTLTDMNNKTQDIITGKNRLERRIIKKYIREGRKPIW